MSEEKTEVEEAPVVSSNLPLQKIGVYIISLTLLPSFFGFHAIPLGTIFAPVFYIVTAFCTGGLSCVICAPADVIFAFCATDEMMKKVYDGSWQSLIIPPSMLYLYRKSKEDKETKEVENA